MEEFRIIKSKNYSKVLLGRLKLSKYILKYRGEGPIKLVMSKHLIEEILFNHYSDGSTTCKTFALPLESIRKLDFSNISMDNFYMQSVREFRNFTNLHIDPSKVYKCDLTNCHLDNVTFANGSFTRLKTEGRYPKLDNTSLIECREEIKNGSLTKKLEIDPKLMFKRKVSNCIFREVRFTSELSSYMKNYAGCLFYECTIPFSLDNSLDDNFDEIISRLNSFKDKNMGS